MDEKRNIRNGEIPFETQRATATALLMADTFKKVLESNKCENMSDAEIKSESAHILEHIIIVGGFPRDLLLNRKINDIDIIINLRELCKIQSNHLNKYHCGGIHENEESQCFHYRRYLNKFINDGSIGDPNKTNNSNSNGNSHNNRFNTANTPVPNNKPGNDVYNTNETIIMHNCNYILNSSFWIELLTNNELCFNKLSIKNMPKFGYFHCQIVNTINYNNINLDGQSFDFIDTFETSFNFKKELEYPDQSSKIKKYHSKARQLSQSGIDLNEKNINEATKNEEMTNNNDSNNNDNQFENEDNSDAESMDSDMKQGIIPTQHTRFHSMALATKPSNMMNSIGMMGIGGNNENDRDISYDIYDIPIFSGKLETKLKFYDFTINTLIIPLSSVLTLLYNDNNSYNNNNNNTNKFSLTDWIDLIENSLNECDGIADLRDHQILRVPIEGNDEKIILGHPETYHFWRIIRWLIRMPSFKISDSLLREHITNMDNSWLTIKFFKKYSNCKRFLKRMKYTIENECKTLTDVRHMFVALNLFLFNKKFINIINDRENEGSGIRDSLIVLIKNIETSHFTDNIGVFDIISVFQEFNYPVYMNNYKMEVLLNENKQLKEEMKKLEQKYDELSVQKVILAKTANDTIDELRDYIVKSQKMKQRK